MEVWKNFLLFFLKIPDLLVHKHLGEDAPPDNRLRPSFHTLGKGWYLEDGNYCTNSGKLPPLVVAAPSHAQVAHSILEVWTGEDDSLRLCACPISVTNRLLSALQVVGHFYEMHATFACASCGNYFFRVDLLT